MPTYDDVIDLLKQGAVAEAEELFNALHANSLARRTDSTRQHHRISAAASLFGSSGHLESDGIACYLVENGKKRGPFCQSCYDQKSKLAKLLPLDPATYVCSCCRTECARYLCG